MKNSKNRILLFLLTAVLLLTAVTPHTNAAALAKISGTAPEADLTVTTTAQLQSFAAAVNNGESFEGKTVLLAANIDLGGAGNPWTPIGTANSPFKGTFDGGNHVISGLSVSGGSSVGLFGTVTGGTVENLTVSGTVSGISNVAGVVGNLTDGTIKNCGNQAAVTGDSNVGGIAGVVNGNSTVEACYNAGDITGTTGYIGGVTGEHWRAGTVQNSYNIGTVKGPASVGGVAGGHKAASLVLINCFNAGTVTDTAGSQNNIGAVVGASRGSAENCYYLNSAGLAGSGAGDAIGISGTDTITATLLGVAFTDGDPYPVLTWEKDVCKDVPGAPSFTEGTLLSAKLAEYIRSAVASAKAHGGIEASGTLLGSGNFLAGASSTDTDWMALAMARFGYFDEASGKYYYLIDDGDGYAQYLEAMRAYIENTYNESSGMLHRAKATEWHRAVMTITALGGDAQRFGTYNGAPIDLIADGSYNCVLRQGPGTQGINGWIWGLIALDAEVYNVPGDALYSRERFITEILRLQLTDGVNGNEYGGWVLGGYGSSSDVDITAMAIQALAPYYNDDTVYTYTNANSSREVSRSVRTCVDEALDLLGEMMDDEAGFSSWNTNNVEGVSQVIVALTSLGIDPAKDTRFITSKGETLLDGLLKFRLTDGGFRHVLSGGWNSMACDQATYAMVSYWRLENGTRALYDMRENFKPEDKTAIETAISAIDSLPENTASGYKAALKAALVLLREVPESERRYVYNYARLADAVALIGGEDELDSEAPYAIALKITKLPDKTVYFEKETFDPAGMTVTVLYSDGSSKEVTDYRISPSSPLETATTTVYIIYGSLKASVAVTVQERMPWNGAGTEADPYLIKSADNLAALARLVNEGKNFNGAFFALANPIDLGDIPNWTPIGTSKKQFEGAFDGQYYPITNLHSTVGGLFGYVGDSAVIRNTILASGEIGSENNVSFLGGIACWSNGADFINCLNGATIRCGGYSGGIVGTVRGGESVIQGCINLGTIIGNAGSTAVGGIVGHLSATREGAPNTVTVENCYNTGSVSGNLYIGGIVGQAQDGHQIQNCYNAGSVTSGTEDQAAPIVYYLTNGSSVVNCYYNAEEYRDGIGRGTGETFGKTAAEMKSPEFLQLLGSAFKEDRYAFVNQGYPLLAWQETAEADAVNDVIAAIEAIGTVTDASKETGAAIKNARDAYEALTEAQKALVSNYDALLQAEEEFAKRKAETDAPETEEPSPTPGTPAPEVPSPATSDAALSSVFIAFLAITCAVCILVWKKKDLS